MRRIMLAVSAAGGRVWRNNVAQGVVGHPTIWPKKPERIAVAPGDAVVRHARILHAGLCVGSSDMIGLTPVLIQHEHVGLTLAVFTALEAKSGAGRLTPEQTKFIDVMDRLGGIAGEVRTPEDALRLLGKYRI
jgi:hypothetical protein